MIKRNRGLFIEIFKALFVEIIHRCTNISREFKEAVHLWIKDYFVFVGLTSILEGNTFGFKFNKSNTIWPKSSG